MAKSRRTQATNRSRTQVRGKKRKPSGEAFLPILPWGWWASSAEVPLWNRFARAAGRHPHLERDTLVALPSALLAAIRSEVPHLLTPDDLRFETALAQTGVFGFFHRRPIGYGPLAALQAEEIGAPLDRKAQRIVDRDRKSHTELERMRDEEYRRHGATEADIANHHEREQQARAALDRTAAGYAGWLATDAGFRRAVAAMKARWSARIAADRAFPPMPVSWMGETASPPPREDREFAASWLMFYRRWGLERMATWELPVPLREQILTHHLYDRRSLEAAGLELFIPWHVLRDRTLTLKAIHEAAEHRRLGGQLEHLEGWLDGQPKNFGVDRHVQLLRMHVYGTLALQVRYAERLSGAIERLDLAFQRSILGATSKSTTTSLDTIRKIRFHLRKRLREGDP